VRPASKAQPDRSVDRVIAERGLVTVGELEALTGERRRPTIGQWAVSAVALAELQRSLSARIETAGALGLDVASLDDRERAVVATLAGITVDAGRARHAAAADPLADHPFLAILRDGGVAPPDPVAIDRAQLRELVRRGQVVERDSVYFHPQAVELAADAAAALLRTHPTGFTMSQFREALGNTRKHSVPLATELDARGVTRRRGDVRIAGPKLPES
jgi:selenocysteine-specific elongation factor